MDIVVYFLIRFIVLFVVFLLIYYLLYKNNKADYKKLKKDDYIKIFIARYDLDLRKTNYKDVLNVVMFNNAFIIAFTTSIIISIKGFVLRLLVSFVILFALIYILYEISGRSLKKKEKESKRK